MVWCLSKLLSWTLLAALFAVGVGAASEGTDDASGESTAATTLGPEDLTCVEPGLVLPPVGNTIALPIPVTPSPPCLCAQGAAPVGPPAPGSENLNAACTLLPDTSATEAAVEEGTQTAQSIAEDPERAGDHAPDPSSAQPEESPDDTAHSAYTGGSRTVEKSFAGVDLPDDPRDPEVGVRGLDVNSDPEPSLVPLQTKQQGKQDEQETTDAGSKPPGMVGYSPEASFLSQEHSFHTPVPSGSNGPGQGSSEPAPRPGPASIMTVSVVLDPEPSQVMILAGTILASALVLYLAAPAATYLRDAATSLRRSLRALWLLPLPLLVRIKSHQAIEDPKRRVLYNLIHENPGISTKELCEAASMSRSAVDHHILVVARAGLVVTESIGRGRHHFPAAEFLDREQRRARALLRSDRNRDVLHAVQENPGITLTHLVKDCGLHASQAHQVLESLHGAGLVLRRKEGTSVQYRAADAALSA